MVSGKGLKELTKQEKTRIKTMLEYGKDVPADDLVSYYLDNVKGSPEDTGYKKSIRTTDLLTKYASIDDDENLSKEQKKVVQEAIQKETGLTQESVEYYQVAKLSTSLKYEKALEDIESKGLENTEDLMTYLAEGREMVAGEMFATSGVIDQFYEDGFINKAQVKYLKALRWNPAKKAVTLDRDYTGSGSGKSAKSEASAAIAKFLGAASNLPSIGGGEVTTPKSQVKWGNMTFSAPVSEQEVKLETPTVKAPQITMEQFFTPKKTSLSTGEATQAVNAVRSPRGGDSRLKLHYSR
jgi:hypothetical protein